MSARQRPPKPRDYRGEKIVPKRSKKAQKGGKGRFKETGVTNVAKVAEGPIRKSMRVSDIVALLPEAGPVVSEYGLHCFSCTANALETLEEGCVGHGFSDDDIDALVSDLNMLFAKRPPRPQTITVTKAAAVGLLDIATKEGRTGQVLVVTLDESGGFCLEFAIKAGTGDRIFVHREVPEMRVAASHVTLSRIGGATIDLREGRFKLDLPEDKTCGCGGDCACKTKGAGGKTSCDCCTQ